MSKSEQAIGRIAGSVRELAATGRTMGAQADDNAAMVRQIAADGAAVASMLASLNGAAAQIGSITDVIAESLSRPIFSR